MALSGKAECEMGHGESPLRPGVGAWWPGAGAYRPSPNPSYLPDMSPRSAARLQLLGAALLFSTGGAAIKAAEFDGWQIASFRSGIAALALWLMSPAARRSWTLEQARG
jgi:hypothetical protein